MMFVTFVIISDIDGCISQPCKNNGTCIDLNNNYECLCKAGFNGNHCTKSKCDVLLLDSV